MITEILNFFLKRHCVNVCIHIILGASPGITGLLSEFVFKSNENYILKQLFDL